jgi:hypothetical protein
MTTELVPIAAAKPQRNWRLRLISRVRPQTGKRRVWDRMAALERDLANSRNMNVEQARLIEQLHAELESAQTAAWNAIDRADELDRKLQVAVEANDANKHRIDFIFPERDQDDPVDVATQPVPVIRQQDPVAETVLFPALTQVRLINPVKVDTGAFHPSYFPKITTPPPYVPKITVGNSPMAGTDPTHTVAATVVMKKVTVDE